ncbi:hypothetical protein [Alsobacter sp. R-9]
MVFRLTRWDLTILAALAASFAVGIGLGWWLAVERAPATVAAAAAVPPRAARLEDPTLPLKTLLGTGRYAAMVDKWPEVEPALRIPWARDLLFGGGTTAVASPLVRDLWTARPGDGAGADPKTAAVQVLFYALLRVRIDGEHCRDTSGPGDLVRDMLAEFRPVLRHAEGFPVDLRRQLVMEASGRERATASVRGPDRYPCSKGRLTSRSDLFLPENLVAGRLDRARDAAVRELLGGERRGGS